ncbi:hypothetical protein [Endozoicomonas sp. Mp262]|uniref:hypothetical protein n=1 Tax=Endozoicomonas sp. Mp262 TaxID=2919499 RepID=UPI0021E06C96
MVKLFESNLYTTYENLRAAKCAFRSVINSSEQNPLLDESCLPDWSSTLKMEAQKKLAEIYWMVGINGPDLLDAIHSFTQVFPNGSEINKPYRDFIQFILTTLSKNQEKYHPLINSQTITDLTEWENSLTVAE